MAKKKEEKAPEAESPRNEAPAKKRTPEEQAAWDKAVAADPKHLFN